MTIVRKSSIERNRLERPYSGICSWLEAAATALAVYFIVAWPALAQADTAAFDFDEPGRGTTVSGTDGFQFKPRMDLVVTALGYYDRERNGLHRPHPVALFSALTTSPLVSVTVSRSSRIVGNFRYEPTPPVVLKAGHTYVLAAFTPGNEDPPADSPDDLRVASPIGYQGYLFEFGRALVFPTHRELFSSRTFFGPNFRFRPATGGLVRNMKSSGQSKE